MNSIRTKTTLLTICVIVVTMVAAMAISVSAIRNIGSSSSDEMLYLLCQTGEKNLDSYFESVAQSVEMVSSFADEDLRDMPKADDDALKEHVGRVNDIFADVAKNTNGVLTYYYRIDPAISEKEKGFWYTNLDGKGFVGHEPTDITLYDTQDTSKLVWFTVPKATGKPIWQPPYITDNLDVRVISYNAPIYRDDKFIGVVGIEIDYSTMAGLVDSIDLYDNGYAFINDAEGEIVYHPHIDVAELSTNHPKVPEGLLSESTYITYRFDGVEKRAVWLPLSNGMRLNVTVPVSEIDANWMNLIYQILAVSAILLIIFIVITLRFTGHITKPLRDLTEVAEQVDAGNYDVKLDYDGNDEVGILTRTVNKLVSHLKIHIEDLNSLAYADALTSVRNKGAFDIYSRELQSQIDRDPKSVEFALAVFDCDGLKAINDRHGHQKGDVYLKTASHLICHVFQHSPVFRIGGDEFAVLLQNDDYAIRDELVERFLAESQKLSLRAEHEWEQVHVSVGVAVYDPLEDDGVNDVTRRADKLMYDNKRARKAQR